MQYSEKMMDHCENPRNVGKLDENDKSVGTGSIGSPACGDMMKVWIKVNKKQDRIKKMKWQTFGCGSAIAATSILSVIISEKGGMKLDKALKIKPQDITKKLGGLPIDRLLISSLKGYKWLT